MLHNPDMGWVLYENYPVDPRPGGSSTLVNLPEDDFAGVDAVAVMFAWSDVEKSEGNYDFSKVDFACDYWRKRGKEIQLRLSAESLLWWNRNDPPSGMGVPGYLLEKLPAEKKQVRHEEGFDFTVVDARDPYYRERLTKFLRAVGAHYRGERAVTIIDLRGYGLWGEWHRGYRYATVKERRQALCSIIDLWSAALPEHWLALSFSHDPDGPKEYFDGPAEEYVAAATKTYDDFLRYSAFDYALTKPNVTLRRDGVGGAVYSNQRKFADEAFKRLDRGPMITEFHGGYAEAKVAGEKWLRFKIDDALSLHPNYINLLGYAAGDARDFIGEQRRLFDEGLRKMGYRLVPTSATLPQRVKAGEEFEIKMTWVNRGVGRAMRDYRLRLRAGDATCDAGTLPTSKWIKGQTYDVSVRASFKSAGRHAVQIELIDPASDRPIALPLKSNDVATIEVMKP